MKEKSPPDEPGGDPKLEAARPSAPSLPVPAQVVYLLDESARPIDRLVFVTADDLTIGWGVAREVFDAEEESLPVHLLDIATGELVPVKDLLFISTAYGLDARPSWTRSHYVVRRWPSELVLKIAKLLRKIA